MEPRPPRRKKYCKSKPGCSLPIIETITGPYKFSGAFDGHSIVVDKQSEMEKINSMGCFGKGTLSRNFPSYNKIQMPILRVRQHEAYNALVNEKGSIKNIVEKHTLIVDDSDVDDELYFENLKPLVKKLKLPFAEVLRLSLEEAYYLMCKDCMKINDLNGVSLTKESAWTLFSKQQKTFIHNYIVYNYFRRRDWVVKSGLKFGGDFLLYKDGPAYYHASFLVVIDIIKSKSQDRLYETCSRSMDWTSLTCLDRLTETAAKQLLIVQVVWPETLTIEDAQSPICIDQFSVRPLLMRRWVPKVERTKYVNNSQWKNTKKCKTDQIS